MNNIDRYRQALKATGWRSWKRANKRRADLIAKRGHRTPAEHVELACLQHLADLYVRYKTNDSLGRSITALRQFRAALTVEK